MSGKKVQFLRCNLENGQKRIMWTPGSGSAEKPFIGEFRIAKAATTLGEQAEEALREWYAAFGKSVPQDEVEICRRIDAVESKEFERLCAANKPKPVYGTPEFWKDYHARKKAGLVKPSKKGATGKQRS